MATLLPICVKYIVSSTPFNSIDDNSELDKSRYKNYDNTIWLHHPPLFL